MADTKQDVLDMLRELGELTEIDEANPQSFRVRAYESAAQAIAAQATDLGKLTTKELQKIEGIGKSTADKIRELLETGRVAKLESLRAKHPPSIVALTRIQGLGPKALAKLRSELGVASLDDLRRALADHKVRGLAGFGAKSEEKLARAIERLDAQVHLRAAPADHARLRWAAREHAVDPAHRYERLHHRLGIARGHHDVDVADRLVEAAQRAAVRRVSHSRQLAQALDDARRQRQGDGDRRAADRAL